MCIFFANTTREIISWNTAFEIFLWSWNSISRQNKTIHLFLQLFEVSYIVQKYGCITRDKYSICNKWTWVELEAFRLFYRFNVSCILLQGVSDLFIFPFHSPSKNAWEVIRLEALYGKVIYFTNFYHGLFINIAGLEKLLCLYSYHFHEKIRS